MFSQENPEQIALLLQKQWRLYHLTPLYRFSYTMLKKYSNELSVFIACEKKKGIAVEVGIEVAGKAKFSMLAGLRATESDPEAIFIQVRFVNQFPTASQLLWLRLTNFLF